MKVLFYSKAMRDLAVKSRETSGFQLCYIDWKRFENGFPNLRINEVENYVEDRDIIFLASFEEPGDVFEQIALIWALPYYGAKSIKIILPYFPTATMERISKKGEIATAKSLCRMFCATPTTCPVQVLVIDPHVTTLSFYMSDGVHMYQESAIPLLLDRVRDLKTKPVYAFPDAGARKRFGPELPKGSKLITCDKVRNGNKREVKILEGNPKGRHVVIIDDLIKTGGTILECRKALVKAGAKKVSVWATHGEFPQESWKRFTPELFEHVWITDSCPTSAKAVARVKPFEILSLAPLLWK